jgi:hypothetical protein
MGAYMGARMDLGGLVANALLEECVSSFPRSSARQGLGTRLGYTALGYTDIVGALLIAACASRTHAQQAMSARFQDRIRQRQT